MLDKFSTKRMNKNDDGILCIDTYRIFDSCKIKEFAKDLRVYLSESAAQIVNMSVSMRIKSAKNIWTAITSDKIPFSNGYYQVSIRYFFLLTLECCMGLGNVREVNGLCMFDKNVVLFGGDGEIDSFVSSVSATFCPGGVGEVEHFKKIPRTVIDCADPIPLKIRVINDPNQKNEILNSEMLPDPVLSHFPEPFSKIASGTNVYASLGIFSIVRMERKVEIIVPACDYCIPRDEETKEFSESDAFQMFRDMEFPIGEFFGGIHENKMPAPAAEAVKVPTE